MITDKKNTKLPTLLNYKCVNSKRYLLYFYIFLIIYDDC